MKNPDISKAFDAFSRMKVLIVGDVMIDAYMWGKVDRISPEAPVPVVHIHKDENRPGGAANVAINIKTMGATPILCSVTGNDRHGAEFMRLLKENGMQESGIVLSDTRQTTVKTRIIGNHHQLLRVDNETTRELNVQEEEALQQKIQTIISEQRPDVIILEDYDKGVFTEGLIRFITQQAKSANIPVTVDPKKKNFNTYRDVTLFKPNLSELKAGLKLDSITTDKDSLTKASQTFLQDRNIGIVMVTLSESGVFIADKNDSVIIPAHIRDIADVSGAGDTVISVASLCLAAGLPKEDIAVLSNLAGGLVCESVGVVPIDREKLKAEAGRHM